MFQTVSVWQGKLSPKLCVLVLLSHTEVLEMAEKEILAGNLTSVEHVTKEWLEAAHQHEMANNRDIDGVFS
jgi:hypothetical protein